MHPQVHWRYKGIVYKVMDVCFVVAFDNIVRTSLGVCCRPFVSGHQGFHTFRFVLEQTGIAGRSLELILQEGFRDYTSHPLCCACVVWPN